MMQHADFSRGLANSAVDIVSDQNIFQYGAL